MAIISDNILDLFITNNINGIEDRLNYINDLDNNIVTHCKNIDCIIYPLSKVYFYIDPNGDRNNLFPFLFNDTDNMYKYIHIKYEIKTKHYSINLYISNYSKIPVGIIYSIYFQKDDPLLDNGIFVGHVNLFNVQSAKKEILSSNIRHSYDRANDIISTLHHISFIFGLTQLLLYDIAKSSCSSDDIERPIPISLSRKLANLSYYYQQFGYQILPSYLVMANEAEKSFEKLRKLTVKPFFTAVGIYIDDEDITFEDYFIEFNNRHENIPCIYTAKLLLSLLDLRIRLKSELDNALLTNIMKPILEFMNGNDNKFFYILSRNDVI